jgi:hypothetical protein
VTTRQRAIRALEIAASTPGWSTGLETVSLLIASDESSATHNLAWSAACAAACCLDDGRVHRPSIMAEAACLLREGWSPGEELVRL